MIRMAQTARLTSALNGKIGKNGNMVKPVGAPRNGKNVKTGGPKFGASSKNGKIGKCDKMVK